MKKTNTRKIIAVLAAVAVLCCTGCAGLKDIRDMNILSFNMKSLSLRGLEDISATLEATVDNPARNITVESLDGTAFRNGKTLGTFLVQPFTIPGRDTSEVEIDCRLAIDKDFPALELMGIASHFNADEFTVDITLKARIGKGACHKVSFKEIPLKYFIDNSNALRNGQNY